MEEEPARVAEAEFFGVRVPEGENVVVGVAEDDFDMHFETYHLTQARTPESLVPPPCMRRSDTWKVVAVPATAHASHVQRPTSCMGRSAVPMHLYCTTAAAAQHGSLLIVTKHKVLHFLHVQVASGTESGYIAMLTLNAAAHSHAGGAGSVACSGQAHRVHGDGRAAEGRHRHVAGAKPLRPAVARDVSRQHTPHWFPRQVPNWLPSPSVLQSATDTTMVVALPERLLSACLQSGSGGDTCRD